jgi:mevalonate kinase
MHPLARAEGKVILIGEHAVVHGCPALAAGLPAGLVLRAIPQEDAASPHRVIIPAWGLDLELEAAATHPVAKACAEVISHCDGPMRGWRIEGETSLPARAGLGSSATLSIALARLVLGPQGDTQELIDASLAGERVFHGTPSGIDSAVAATGGVIRFCRGAAPQPLETPEPLPLLVIPTGIPRNTLDQVDKVHARLSRFPESTRAMFSTLHHLCDEAQTALLSGNWDDLGSLFDASHALLGALGVSTPDLDGLCHTARKLGARGAKLTGAGGGGSLIAIPPQDPEASLALLDALSQRGLAAFRVDIGGAPREGGIEAR